MSMPPYTIAHHFPAVTGALLAAHPLVGEARAVDPTRRWALPTDVDIIFALHAAGTASDHDVPPPTGWPGRVRFVQLASSGIDGYPAWLLAAPVVATAAGTGAVPIAEFVLAAMLNHAKRLPQLYAQDGGPVVTQADLLAAPLAGLEGKTLGLVGVGHIGSRVAALAAAFGMKVIAHRHSDVPSPSPHITIAPLAAVLARADHIVLAAPLTATTAGMLGAAAFAQAKPGVHIVNIARGGLIDQTALAAALRSGQVGGATLDVTDPEPLPAGHPLWSAPNLKITPHVAWSSADTPRRIFALFADNISRLAAGTALVNQQSRPV